MKETMNLIHRDVKPRWAPCSTSCYLINNQVGSFSNILLNRQGQVKICDFGKWSLLIPISIWVCYAILCPIPGISGHLTNSVAKTLNAGCKPYMPPERIDGEFKEAYGVQADVWSLGITLVEIATGTHPYSKWKTPFEQLKEVVHKVGLVGMCTVCC